MLTSGRPLIHYIQNLLRIQKNVRFAFSTDGINPFGDLASLYTMYNLPTWI
jgi:hypothetical protein